MTEEELKQKAKEYAVINCGSYPIQEDLREAAMYSYIDGYNEGQDARIKRME